MFNLLVLFICFQYCYGSNQGVLRLDSSTFNKTLQAFPFSFVKFDTKSPGGQKHEDFIALAQELINEEKLLIAEVRIPGFGNLENLDLAKRFQLDQEILPEFIFFKRKKYPGKPFDYDVTRYGGVFDVDNFRDFLRKKTKLWIGLPGCVKTFDELAEFFGRNSGKDQLQAIKQIQEKISQSDDEKARIGEKYLKIMKITQTKGMQFIQTESQRIQKLLKESISKEKAEDLKLTLNILKSFHFKPIVKDEL